MNNISSCVGGLRAILYCRCPTNTSVSFRLCFLCTYSRMYTGKILSLVEGLQAVLSSTGNRFFFQGQCAIMELCYSLWLPDHWQNAHTHTRTFTQACTHTKPHMSTLGSSARMWLHNINKIFRGKIRVKRHQTLKSRWCNHFFYASALFYSPAQPSCASCTMN